MTADREGLREALAERLWAQSIYPNTYSLSWAEAVSEAESTPRSLVWHSVDLICKNADALLTGPLSDLLTKADSAERMEAERDEARARSMPHMCRDGHPEIRHADSGDDERCPVCRERDRADFAEAETARLTAEVEALKAERDEAVSHLPEGLRDASLAGAVQALAFSARTESDSKWRWGHALTIGLAFANEAAGEEWEHGGMASIDVCQAMAATLKCECDSDEWAEMAKAGAARLAEHLALSRAADKAETVEVEHGE